MRKGIISAVVVAIIAVVGIGAYLAIPQAPKSSS